ncbi:MAG: hypothetical protein H5T86_05050, partial [Armatimonadetes bacterium]|nr:hypothetical protein [Armatimonadota bacterium]
IAPRDVVRGNWFGGYRSQRGDPSVLPGFLWNALFDGNNLIQYFALATIETIFNTDYSLAYYNRWFIDDFKALLDGPAQLIQRAAYDFDPVAVLHSQSSRHLAALEGQFGGYDLAHTVLLEALENLQFHVRYLTERHPELIKYGTTKVIFLPSCQALSAATCDALRRFVEDGGLLIADVRPGVADAACRFLDDPPLASVFGVRFGNAPQPGEPDRLEFPPGNTLASVRPDASVQLAGATSMRSVGNVPVLIVNKLGRGRAILLNFGIAQVQTAGNTPVRRVIARLIEELLQDAGVQPQAQVLGDDGRRIPDCRVARFVYGDTVIHGLLLSRGGSSPQACVFTVGRPRHLYDTLERKYLGYAQRAELKLTPSHGKIICALPDRLSAIEVLAPRAAVCGQRLAVQVRLRGGGDRHLLRVYAFDPAGRQRYARTVVAADGPAQAVIPLALNDPPGKWMLVARDVATGVSGSAAIMVAEAGSGGS